MDDLSLDSLVSLIVDNKATRLDGEIEILDNDGLSKYNYKAYSVDKIIRIDLEKQK